MHTFDVTYETLDQCQSNFMALILWINQVHHTLLCSGESLMWSLRLKATERLNLTRPSAASC